MSWETIKKTEIESWNEKLKLTEAPFYQYPYSISGEYSSLFSGSQFTKYVSEGQELAFAGIIEIGFFPFKIAVIDGGPVVLQKNVNLQILLEDLKKFAKNKGYAYLQIRPPYDFEFENLFKRDNDFQKKIFFPFHKKIEFDWNIYNAPEDKLLAGFKLQCRRKIVLAGRVPFEFYKLDHDADLSDVRKLFKEVTKNKGYKFTPFDILERIFNAGKKYNLCDIYVASLNGKIVNAVLILKDGQSFYHFTSGLLVDGYKYNESPPAKLHLFIMQDCFHNENKKYYNISFGGSDNLIRFKELFNPVELERPSYFTYIINKRTVSFFQKFSPDQTEGIRTFFKDISNFVFRHLKFITLIYCFAYFSNLLTKFIDLEYYCSTNIANW